MHHSDPASELIIEALSDYANALDSIISIGARIAKAGSVSEIDEHDLRTAMKSLLASGRVLQKVARNRDFKADYAPLMTAALHPDDDDVVAQAAVALQDFLEEFRQHAAQADVARQSGEDAKAEPAAVKGHRRRRRQTTPRKLTAKQLEAVGVFGECEYNYSKTARKLGLSITAAKDRIVPAYKKLGEQVPVKPKTTGLRTDHRGAVSIAGGQKPPSRGDGHFRSGDRRKD